MSDGNFDNVSATGNIVADGNISAAGNLITSVLAFNSPTTANIIAGNIALYHNLNMTGSLSAGGNIIAEELTGNLVTADQPNITSVGALSSLSVNGNIVTGNISVIGIIYGNVEYENSVSVAGNVSANFLLANTIAFKSPTTANLSVGNLALFNSLNITGAISTSGNITGARFIGSLVTANQSNITNVGTLTSLSVSGNATSGNILTAGIVSATGNATFGNIGTSGRLSANTVFANSLTFNSPTTANLIAGNLALYHNISMTGSISAGGNIRGNYIFGNGSQLTGISGGNASTGNVTFNGTTMSGPAGSVNNYSIYIKPSADFINALQIYPTADNDIHLFETTGNAITLGSYGESQVSVNGPNSANANITVQSNGNTWTFGEDGSFSPPVQPSNQRTGSGLVLKLGSINQQAIITGPVPVPGSYDAAPRLVVAGQDGVNSGEGGDIYLWAGRSGPTGGTGGDIKVDAGQGYYGSEGGTIKIRGGSSDGSGAGISQGGFIEITAGSGNIGAPINITAGQGNSQANSANVSIHTAYGGTWNFDNAGTLTLPHGQLDYNSGYSRFKDATNTGVQMGSPDDQNYVNVDNSAITIQTNSDALAGKTQYNWQFDTDGNLTLPYSGGNTSFTMNNIGNVAYNSASPLSSGGSLEFVGDESNHFLVVPNEARFAPGTGDFTIEWYQYVTSSSHTYPRPFSLGVCCSNINSLLIGLYEPSANNMAIQTQAGYHPFPGWNDTLNVWQHIAVVRSSGTITIYQDGVAFNSVSIPDDIAYDPTNNYFLSIGSPTADGTTGTEGIDSQYIGLITNMRYVVGTAVYTGNFTPSTTPLTLIPGTELLLQVANSGTLNEALYFGTAATNSSIISNGNAWTFNGNGTLELPVIGGYGLIKTANGYPELLAYGSSGGFDIHGGPELDWMNSDDPANTFSNVNTLRNTLFINGGGLYVGINENGNVGHFSGSLTLNSADGNLSIPSNLNVASGNISTSGNITAANISAGNISLSGNIFAYGANIYSVNGLTMEGGNLTMSSITGMGGSISAEGNIIGANLSATSNISGQNINGGNLSLSGNVLSNLNIQQGNISVSGNITSGSELTVVSANITGVQGLTVSGGDITIPSSMSGGSLSAYGNITAGNLITTGSGGNITLTGGNILGVNNISTGTVTLVNGAVIRDTAGNAVAFGLAAGANTQGTFAVAVGILAGNDSQGSYATAIGPGAGASTQGQDAVAVGYGAGNQHQGTSAVAIGKLAGETSQGNNSIILNATGSALNQTTANTFTVKPVRGDSTANLVSGGFKAVYYNSSTGEFCYSTD